MIQLSDGSYVSRLNGLSIKIKPINELHCELFVDGIFKGRAPLEYMKKRINMLERKQQFMLKTYVDNRESFEDFNRNTFNDVV